MGTVIQYTQRDNEARHQRWDRIERLVRFITTDLMTPIQGSSQFNTNGDQVRGYRVPIEKPPYSITEESDLE